MLPIGPLMVEHRLIERMIRVMAVQAELLETGGKVDPRDVETIVRFLRDFIDRCHHGKEENILFRELARKEISPEQRRIMDELIEDHRLGRRLAESAAEANARYREGEAGALSGVADAFCRLVAFYPEHIRKEDHEFFIPAMDYFTRDEKDAMLQAGWAADSLLLRQEYEALVAGLEPKGAARL